jgi:hypothetical protein
MSFTWLQLPPRLRGPRLAALWHYAKGSGPGGAAISKETVTPIRTAERHERRHFLLNTALQPINCWLWTGNVMNSNKNNQRVYAMSVASVYRLYIEKAEKKGRTKEEVDEVIRWLTGHSQASLERELANKTTFETFFTQAKLNPARELITGSVCGVKLAEIEEPLMKEIRYLDKLIDELAKGRPMAKILRQPVEA